MSNNTGNFNAFPRFKTFCKSFGGSRAIDDVSFQIGPNENGGIDRPNGCGQIHNYSTNCRAY